MAAGKGGGAPKLRPKDYIAGFFKSKGSTAVKGGNQENRAVVWQVDASSGATRPFATGLRNPTALAFEPTSRQLWAVVNERDELGPDLVPDYLTSVREGAFYGWPYAYWGPNVDRRVQPQNDRQVQAALTDEVPAPVAGSGAVD